MTLSFIKKGFIKIILFIGLPLCIFSLSGCGFHGYHNFSNDEHNGVYRHYHPGYKISPEHINNNQYYSPRNYNNQKINNSINISGNQYQDFELNQNRIFYVDGGISGVKDAVDGTINQMILEDRKIIRVPTCRSIIQSVNAVNYNSFQYINCN